MRLALFQPDIPQNTGTLLRLGACLDVDVDIIEPAGFSLGDRALKRAGMDYLEKARLCRHPSWEAFLAGRTSPAREGGPHHTKGRLLLLTTRASQPYTSFAFAADDTLLLGRESAGVPQAVHDAADAHLRIPLVAGVRSLNVAVAAAMVLGEALRQCNLFPATMGSAASGMESQPWN
jgi:tRNA (cytidine/uridine-2'-O-)-methyltransferase